MKSDGHSKGLNIEKPELEIRFIPIICSAPLIYAHSHGFLERNGLRVNLKPAPGWSGIKELMTHGIVDAVHMLSPMPLACNLGIDGQQADIRLVAVQNVNGQALTLAKKHLAINDVRDMKGFCFGVPYRFSMHYYLLCHFLAKHGLNPLKDVTIREVAPPRMPYYLEKGWVDGIFAPEPFNQIPVYHGTGFIYILSKDIWPGHPCCSFATSQGFIDKYPNTYRALLKSVLEAELVLHRANPDQRKAIAREICDPRHLNQPDPIPVEQALSGHFPDGKGHWHNIPDRIDFIPHPWLEYGSWMLSQMQRWGQLPGKIDHHKVVESVFQQDTCEMAVDLGFDSSDKPRLEGVQPFTGETPLAYARKQPFCAFQEKPFASKIYGLPNPVQERLSEIISTLARVSGDEPANPLEITADDEIGLLEQVLNELILNTTFTRQALAEHGEMLEKRVQQRTAELENEIADRKRTEESLRVSEEKFRAISNSALDAVIMIDASANIVLWNPTAEKMFGYSGEEAIGRNIHAVLAPNRYRQEAAEGFSHFERSGRGPIIGAIREIEALRKDGSEMPAELSISPIKLKGQWWAVAFVRDITERKRAEEELKERAGALNTANAELQAANLTVEAAAQAKSDFLANMSHEIRTPMNGIIGMSGLLSDTSLTKEQREYMNTIRQSADSLLMIVNDILDFSKIEAGQLDLELLDFDLRTVLDSTVDLMALKAQEKSLELTCEIEPDLPVFLGGDPERLRQILINLINNAIKFTTEGEVTVRVSLDHDGGDRVTLRFDVTDTGVGIASDQKDVLFDAFTQADASTSRRHGGTGLGLAISKRLVGLIGGQIGVESKLRQGSTFWFTAVFEKRPPIKEPAWERLEDIRDRHILVVDDNATNRRLMQQMLQSWGCRHDEVSNAEAALEKLRTAVDAEDPFDVAILDMAMPGIDGAMLGRMIKEEPTIADIALVMMTSLGRGRNTAQEESICFADYLAKPVKQSTLYNCLATVLSRTTTTATITPREIITETVFQWEGTPPRILLAEDNLVNQKVTLGILNKLGCQTDVVDNGQKAVQALEMATYDLVLMDVQMPELDGFQATRFIRDTSSNVRDHEVPIIAMTAHAMKGDREKCLEAGMDDYVSKPVSPGELAETIREWLSAKRSRTTEAVDAEPVGAVNNTEDVFVEHASTATCEPDDANGLFDTRVLLERYDGNIKFVRELIELFLSTHCTTLSDIRQAIDRRDGSTLEQTSHKLKSSLGDLCAKAAMEAAARLERIGRSGDMAEAENAMTVLANEILRFKSALMTLTEDRQIANTAHNDSVSEDLLN